MLSVVIFFAYRTHRLVTIHNVTDREREADGRTDGQLNITALSIAFHWHYARIIPVSAHLRIARNDGRPTVTLLRSYIGHQLRALIQAT